MFLLGNTAVDNVAGRVPVLCRKDHPSPYYTSDEETFLAFARKFRSNWGLGGGKFLLVMFDEKWFWGLVLRSYAKQVAELGVDPRSFSAYHRNHINRCMVVAVTALAFIDSIENGGIAFKLGLFRAQAHKIARQMVREAVRQADGRIKYIAARWFGRKTIYTLWIAR